MRDRAIRTLLLSAVLLSTSTGCGDDDEGDGTPATTGGALQGGTGAEWAAGGTGASMTTGGVVASGGAAGTTGGAPLGATGGEWAAGGTGGVTSGGVSTTGGSGGGTSTDGCSAATWPGTGRYTLDINGTARQYAVRVPAGYTPGQPYKVVFVWHGLTGTLDQMDGRYFAYYGMADVVDDRTILIAGQGLGTAEDPTQTAWRNRDGEDVAFVRAVVSWVEESYCVDPSRIFSTGFSYGGVMSNIMGCEMNDVFRAIAPVAGMGPNSYMGSPSAPDCQGAVAALVVHGTADAVVPFSSGEGSRDLWLGLSGCSAAAPVAVAPAEYCVEYQQCDPASPLVWCVHDGGHEIMLDWLPQAIWDFFSRF